MNVKDFARALACAIGLFSGPAIADTFTNVYVQPTPYEGRQATFSGAAYNYTVTVTGAYGGIYTGQRYAVSAGTTYTVSAYFRLDSSNAPRQTLHLGVSKNVMGGTGYANVLFNPITGALVGIDPALSDYAIIPIPGSNWIKVSATFQATVAGNASVDFISTQAGQVFEVNNAYFQFGPYGDASLPITQWPDMFRQDLINADLGWIGTGSPVPGRASAANFYSYQGVNVGKCDSIVDCLFQGGTVSPYAYFKKAASGFGQISIGVGPIEPPANFSASTTAQVNLSTGALQNLSSSYSPGPAPPGWTVWYVADAGDYWILWGTTTFPDSGSMPFICQISVSGSPNAIVGRKDLTGNFP